MYDQIEQLEKDGLLAEYIEEFAEMTLGCTTANIDEFYTRISEDLVQKGAYLTQEEDSRLVRLLALRSETTINTMMDRNRELLFEKFRELGVDL